MGMPSCGECQSQNFEQEYERREGESQVKLKSEKPEIRTSGQKEPNLSFLLLLS